MKRLVLTLMSTAAVCAVASATPAAAQDTVTGERCMAFIQTGHPGGAVSVPYGNVYRTLADARKDAVNRCSQTTLAQEGWGPCRSWCLGVGP